MVLESLMNPFSAKHKPWEMFFLGFFYLTIGVFLSMWVFAKYASLVMITLTVLALGPLLYTTMKSEEQFDCDLDNEKSILIEHSKSFSFLMWLFVGITIACAFWYLALPEKTAGGLFNIQSETITSINSRITGLSIDYFQIFTKIFMNNFKVLIFCVLFAFIYGVGSIFILTWNASVIGVAMGNFFRSHFAIYASAIGIVKVAGYFHIGSLSVLRYTLHGIPEVLAYFVGGMAGGIISVAIINHDFGTKNFEKILLDASDLVLMSVGLLLFAALLEVFVTPIFF